MKKNQISTKLPRIAFAGDRDISVKILEFILSQDVKPLALMLPKKSTASHSDQLIRQCPFLSEDKIFRGRQFRESSAIETLAKLQLDYIIGIHFPYIIPCNVLNIPESGFLNLHPAFLPYNRGWHTPSWAILESTPIGATLHLMDTGVDTGDIIHQKLLDPFPEDTAHTLYQRLKRLEYEVFIEAWPKIVAGIGGMISQRFLAGTLHKREDLFHPKVQKIDIDETIRAGSLIDKLRALSTNRIDEAAYFEIGGKRYHIQINIQRMS